MDDQTRALIIALQKHKFEFFDENIYGYHFLLK